MARPTCSHPSSLPLQLVFRFKAWVYRAINRATIASLSNGAHAQLPAGRVAVVAESFSGPLALLLADRCPRVVAVVLCASFVESPLPRLFERIPSFVWDRPPPSVLLSTFLTGGNRSLAKSMRSAMLDLSGDVVAGRNPAALRVDVTAELERLSRPLLCLWAKRDWIVRAGSRARVHAIKPAAESVEIDAPHLLLQARPVEAWSHIKPSSNGRRRSMLTNKTLLAAKRRSRCMLPRLSLAEPLYVGGAINHRNSGREGSSYHTVCATHR